MQKRLAATLMTVTAMFLASCGGKDSGGGGAATELEKGQVVATVDGQDVTIHELNAELQGVALPSGERRKLIEQAALQQVVNRHILADIARDRGLDKTPAFILQERRMRDALLVQLLQRQLASKLPAPTQDEARRFIEQNPDTFAQRKIFKLDQIQFAAPDDLRKLAAYEPIKTMDEFEARLIQDGIEYRRAPGTLDTVGANPQLIAQITKLPAGEIFMIPNGGAVLASRVTETKVEPFTGDRATQYAMNMIQQTKLAAAATKELDEPIKKARDAVKYQTGYAPPAQPKAAATPAAGATPAAVPAPAAK